MAISGSNSLEGFFETFNNESNQLVTILDPYNTADVTFDFFPDGNGEDESFVFEQVKAMGMPDALYNKLYKPMRLDLTYYVQSITVPNFTTLQGNSAETWYIGRFPVNGNAAVPESNELTFEMLNTRGPILDRLFYPWLKESTLPYWSYARQPYTTATIMLDMTRHADVKYIFIGARPNFIASYQPSTDAGGTMTRQVKFIFDFMFIVTGKEAPTTTGFSKNQNYAPFVSFGKPGSDEAVNLR